MKMFNCTHRYMYYSTHVRQQYTCILRNGIHAYMYMGTVRPHKSKQGSTTNMNISFSMENKKELLRWDSNPQYTAYEADALPTELPRQLSCLGRIKAIRDKGNQSNLI